MKKWEIIGKFKVQRAKFKNFNDGIIRILYRIVG